jgi:Alternative complex III, ActD subunit
MRVLYGLYSDPEAAQAAYDSLRGNGAGFDERHIAILSAEPFDGFDFFKQDHKTILPWISALGGLVGGVGGFFFAAYTQAVYAIPTGGMPIVPFYADGIITYELTMLGAVLATLVTALITTRLPNWKRQLYDPEVSDGKILIGVVDAPESSLAELKNKLLKAGAGDVKEFLG